MPPITAVSNADLELDHLIARVTLPAASRLPERSSGDRAPQTQEKSRRQRGTPNPPHGSSNTAEEERAGDERPSPQSSPQTEHSLDIRA